MEETKTLDRRKFTLAAALAALSGVAITISGCGGSSYSPSSPGTGGTSSGGTSDKVGQISNNHGHTAMITAAQLTAAGALNLDIQGTATHTHQVSLTAAQIASIAANQRVAQESTTNSEHSHTVTFN